MQGWEDGVDNLVSELKETAEQAEAITRGLPVEVRQGLAREVFRALRASSLLTSSIVSSAGQPAKTGMRPASSTGSETLAEYLAGFGNVSHPFRLVAIAGFQFEHDGTESLTTDEFLN